MNWTTFPILPIAPDGRCSCSDPTCADAGKHPAVRWGAASLGAGASIPIPPGFGVGLATGARSGVVVLDLDRKNGVDGLGALGALAARCGGTIPETLTTITPSGGFHFFFEWPGFKVGNSASALGPGIDVRGDGGYVVLPPSPHKSGGRYAFVDASTPVAPCPEWLRAVFLKPPKVAKRITRETLTKIAKRWAKSKSIAAAELGAALGHVVGGEPFAEEGERDQVLFKLCRDLAREIPDADPGALAELFAPSLEVMPGGPTVESVVEKFTRAVAELGGAARPEVWITDDVPKMADAGEAALARTGDVYRRGDALVRVTEAGTVDTLTRASVREKLSKGARWMTGENASTVPPDWIVDAVRDRHEWPALRHLTGLAEVPVLRPDGTVLDVPGFDAASGVLYHPRRPGPPVPATPTHADALAALERLRDPVGQFAWERPEHLTGWLAAALTPLARNAFEGPAPIFVFDATTAGSGKSLLARLAAVIGSGRIGASAPWPTEEEERRKAITTYALSGNRVLCFDNVTGRLGGKALAQALTEHVWTDRILGASRQWSGPLKVTFYATANNVELREDMDRRVVHVRLNPGIERPELRTGWRFPDVLAHVQSIQPELTAAALTILRAYVVAGRPKLGAPWGSFEAWASWIVGALVWIGLPDPGSVREELREADPEAEHMRAIVRGWRTAFPVAVTARAVTDAMWPPARAWERPLPELSSAFEALLYLKPGERPTAHRVGNLLRRLRGRVLDGRALHAVADPHTRTMQWEAR